MSSPAAPFSRWERMLAVRYLRGRRKEAGVALITLISFIGVTVAVMALIVVMSIMNGFRYELLNRMLAFDGHVFVGEAASVERLNAAPGVTRAVAVVEATALFQGAQTSGGIVRGLSREGLQATPIITGNIKAGSLEAFGGPDEVIVIGSGLAEKMNIGVGDFLTIVTANQSDFEAEVSPVAKSFTVAAIFKVGMSQVDTNFVFMPVDQARAFFGEQLRGGVTTVTVEDPDRVDEFLPAIRAAAGPGVPVSDWRARDMGFWSTLELEQSAMRLVMMFVILIAALNIVSGLVMLVKTKGGDIAILRTMGAGQGSVMRVFLMTGAAVGLLATPFGVALALLFCAYIQPIQAVLETVTGTVIFAPEVYYLDHVPARVDWMEVLFVVVWTLIASVAVTLWPAWRAARLDPVEALRYE